MQVGKYTVPLRMNFDPLGSPGMPTSPQRSLTKNLLGSMSRLAFQQSQGQFSAAARHDIAQGARLDLFQSLAQRLNGLPGSLPPLGQSVTRLVSSLDGPITDPSRSSALSSGSALNLGTATSVTGTSGSGPAQLDPAGKLADQPFATAITAGTLDFRLTLNGSTQNVSVAIDPETQSLNDVLGLLNSYSGISAGYDATSGALSLDVNNQGASFEVTQTGTSSNFLQVALENQQTRITSAQGGAAIANVAGETAYNDLSITYQGQQFEITGLTLANKLKNGTTDEKAADLVAQINSQLAGKTSLLASAVGGVLSFNATETGTQPALATGISFVETAAAATTKGGGKGGGKKGGGDTAATLSLGLDNAATTARVQLSGAPSITATSGPAAPTTAKLGPDATLKDLQGQLGLSSVDGQFTFSINGTQLSFSEDQTLNEVLDGINRSSAGVNAAYDPAGQRVVLTAREAGARAIVVQDQAGNLASGLGLKADQARFNPGAEPIRAAESVTTTELSAEGVAALKRLGEQLNEALSLIETATGPGGAFKNDALLEDLGAALEGLIGPSSGQGISSLSDLGFSIENGEFRLDEARLNGLSPEQLDQANTFLGSFVGEKLQPLVRNGLRAIADETAQAPGEKRMAQQAVMVRAEISRMQQRQQLLLFHQVTLEKQQESLKRQDETLEGIRAKLTEPDEEGQTPDTQPPEVAQPAAVSSVAGQAPPMAPGLGSFGLSG